MKLALILIVIVMLGYTSRGCCQESNPQANGPSPATATLLSIGGTLAPIGMGLIDSDHAGYWIVGGLWLGPATGYIYGGQAGRGMAGIAIRPLIVAATLAALSTTHITMEGGGNVDAAQAFVVLGAAGLTFDIIYDCATVASYINEHSHDHSLRLTPSYSPGKQAAGLTLTAML